MQFAERNSPPARLVTLGRDCLVRLTPVLLIAVIAGCASNDVYHAPVERRAMIVERHAMSPRAAMPEHVPEAPRPNERRPNYHMAMVAKQMLGVPYRYGGKSPSGFDCSGLIYYSYQRIGLRSPRTTGALYQHARTVHPSELRTGDLLFFRLDGRKLSHVGVYLGNNRFVHAPSTGKQVSYAQLSSPFWRNSFIRAGRLY